MSAGRRTLVAWAIGLSALFVMVVGHAALRSVDVDALERSQTADGATAFRGSWHFPRGGPYVLGFDAPDGATLHINNRIVVSGAGLKSKRIVFEPGVVAVELIARGQVRLLWHPPGRRGPLEYVLPSSLSPLPPEQARFDESSGRAIGDGLVALFAVAILLGLIVFSARRRLRTIERSVWLSMAAVFIVALVARLIDQDGAGQTWDEDVNWTAGRNYLVNLLSLDFARDSWQWNYEHPPLMKYIAGIGALWSDDYGPARSLSALVTAVACAVVVVVTRRLYDLQTGLLAGLIAALLPHLIAHGKIVGHEAPTLLWWTAAVWASLEVAASGDDNRTRRLAVLGLIVGAAVFSRFVNVLMAPMIIGIVAVKTPAENRRRVLLTGLWLVPVVALALGYLTWPRLWSSPLTSLHEAWLKLKKPHSPEFYLGSMSNLPARHYFAVYLAATTPIVIAALAAAGGVVMAVKRRSSDLVVVLWLLAPMAVALSPVRQDGVRYIMPSLVAVALMAAIGARAIGQLLIARGLPRLAHALIASLLTLYLGVTAWRVHPYYLDYYGEQVGGPQAVHSSRSFELAWWGEGLDRAIDHVNRHAAVGDSVYKACVVPSHLTWLRHDLWAREARRPDRATWIVVYQPYAGRCNVPADATKVFEVSVLGAPLAQVYRRESRR